TGQLQLAQTIAADLLKRGEEEADAAITNLGHRISGAISFYLGELLTSRAHLEQALARFDPAHRSFYLSFSAQDAWVILLNFLSWDLFCLGYLDQARSRSEAAIEEARKLGHVHSLAVALTMSGFVDWATRSREEAQTRADAVIAVSDEH